MIRIRHLSHLNPLRRIITYLVCTVSLFYSALHAAAVNSFQNHIAKGATHLEKVMTLIAITADNIEQKIKSSIDTVSHSGTS